MYKKYLFKLVCILLLSCQTEKTTFRQIPIETYRDKMKGAWVGQMAGVGWGLPTEFDYIDTIIPENEVPEWQNSMVNQQGNDDLYVEMTFLQSMEKYGTDVSIRQAGIDFANTGYNLWAANFTGRENLRFGIAPPASSHPEYNINADDIDYQIEADYSGIIAPGMPNVAIALGEKFGRLMNYGDGLYGGQFVGGMYAAAYFTNSIDSVIAAGLACIPDESLYAQIIGDVVKWHQQEPENWQKTWGEIMDKYYRNSTHQPFASENEEVWVGIDSKVNGAYIVMGLLYGQGDMEKTIRISMRCGLDSDCNPSNAAGILGAMMGYEKIPEKFKTGLDEHRKFSYSDYDFNKLLEVSESFTRSLIEQQGGKIEQKNGHEIFYIPHQKPQPSPFYASNNPGPLPGDTFYTTAEMDDIKAWSIHHFDTALNKAGITYEIRHCSKSVTLGYQAWNGLDEVFRTAPLSKNRSVRLFIRYKNDSIHLNKTPYLVFRAGHDPGKEWNLKIKTSDGPVNYSISEKTTVNGWYQIDFKLNNEENIQLDMEAGAVGEPATQYWEKFAIVFR